jgi:hypothetical protein
MANSVQLTKAGVPSRRGQPQKCADASGKKYGTLLVLKDLHSKNKHGKSLWAVQCDCGVEKATPLEWLRDGRVVSCSPACPAKPNRKSVQEQCIGGVLASYRNHANKAGRKWELTRDEVSSLLFSDCHWCGDGLSNLFESNTKGSPGACKYNGIDRVDSSKGYTVDNVVSCCWTCNYMKQDLVVKDWVDQMKKIIAKEAWGEK